MFSPLNKILSWILGVSFCSIIYGSSFQELVAQERRPTVSQVIELYQASSPPVLQRASGLCLDKFIACAKDLHYNYPLWFDLISKDAPKMIATFEHSFPGATWAFIGRDMAIFADLFEAFYLSMGQTNRVARIAMSSGTLDNLTDPMAIAFLENNQFDNKLEHPYVFIDAISRQGGRQGRALIQAIYNTYGTNKAQLNRLDWYVNFIGLSVYSTSFKECGVKNFPVKEAFSHLENLKDLSQVVDNIFSTKPIFIYEDSRDRSINAFLGLNEAGYSHWTGVWHGPHGALKIHRNGIISAAILSSQFIKTNDPSQLLLVAPHKLLIEGDNLEAEVYKVRSALLTYQAHVIKKAMSLEFKAAVFAAALDLGYSFPQERQKSFKELGLILSQTSSTQEFLAALSQFNSNKSQRPNLGEFDQVILNNFHHFLSLCNKVSEMALLVKFFDNKSQIMKIYLDSYSLDSYLELLGELKDSKSLDENWIEHDLAHFFKKTPTVEQINHLLSLLSSNYYLRKMVTVMALSAINSRVEYKRLTKMQVPFYRVNSYTRAVKQFKKRHPKPSRFSRTLFRRGLENRRKNEQ